MPKSGEIDNYKVTARESLRASKRNAVHSTDQIRLVPNQGKAEEDYDDD